MAKPRYTADGRPLPYNLYPHNKEPDNPNKWRYKRPKGFKPQWKTLNAPYEEAVQIADRANHLRDEITPAAGPETLEYWRLKYIEWAEAHDPRKPENRSWRWRKSSMKAFAEKFQRIRINRLVLGDLEDWWDGLTYDQQHNRRDAFSKWFQWMLGKGAVKFNPFTTRDDLTRLFEKPKPARARLPLQIHQFWTIYRQAGEMGLHHVQIGMGISLVTTMRESDIAGLRFAEHVVDGKLQKSISKSINQRGAVGASHLSWNLDQHLLLRRLINRARELALKNQGCPYVLSYMPKQRRKGETKSHVCQVTGDRLSKDFAAARDATGLFKSIPAGRTPPTFHSIKGLALAQGRGAGIDIERLSKLAAHTDPRVTEGYVAEQAPTWAEIDIVFDTKMTGGEF